MSRPKIKVKLDRIDWMLEAVTFVFLVVMIGIALLAYGELPETIPTHFNLQGKADGFSGKSGILVMPGIGLLLYVGLIVVNRFPHIFNYPVEITAENAERQYRLASKMIRTLNMVTAGIFCYITYQMVHSAQSGTGGLGTLFTPVLLILTLLPIIIYYIQAKRKQ